MVGLVLLLVFVLSYDVPSTNGQQCEIAQVCVTDMAEDECFGNQVLKPNSHIFGCCPSCQPPGLPGPEQDGLCKPPANCLTDGRYAPVQCKGDLFTGRCFCSDTNGTRIFGQMWRSEAREMTCACSRRRSELEASGRSVVTLHCTPSGDYEPLQCDEGMCWCVQQKTGQPTVQPVPKEDMEHLPCCVYLS